MDEKRITLKQWDEATVEQRERWLKDGYHLSQEDSEALLARYLRKEAA